MEYDVIIVGSGVAGVSAALAFVENNIKPCILDVGYEPEPFKKIEDNFYDFRRCNDTFDTMIGKNYEGLFNILNDKPALVKLIPPLMTYITKNSQALSPVEENDFSSIQSFALGGLANAWGAGLYRFRDYELEKISLSEAELTPYYDKLTKEIGISGQEDSLTPFFGSTKYLLKPLRLSAKAQKLLSLYTVNKENFNKKGFFLGRPRLGVLSENYDNRKADSYNNLEFWQPDLPHIYTPAFTVKKLIKENKILYNKGVVVKTWSRDGDYIIVNATDAKDNTDLSFKCKKLLLGTGVLNTSRIVLASRKDFKTKLKLLDNPAVQIPMVFLDFIGSKLEKDAFGLTQLNVCFKSEQYELLQGSILEITSPARAEFFSKFPLSARSNLAMIRMFLPSMLVFQLFFPMEICNAHLLGLTENNKLRVEGSKYKIEPVTLKEIIKILRAFNIFTHSSVLNYPPSGHGVHYAGTLPMVAKPQSLYECDKLGRLYKEENIHILDGSLFHYLPAKNYSFTVMANAMRIGDCVAKRMLA